ncbi:MAG TPA: HAMP domain-containing sensor histidine kinase [Cyclobacteriaceae bacterium]|nr:HAMP domain-containing sensor histidine kinase [Cyclobacteriaceae bacterium]
MKLLIKTNRYFLAVSLIVFLLGGILFYLLFKGIIDNHLTYKLRERRNYLEKQLSRTDSVIFYQNYSANTLSIVSSNSKLPLEILSDTAIYDSVERKFIPFRQLTFPVANKGKLYKVQTRRAIIEQKEIVAGVVALEVVLFLAFVASLTIINHRLSKRLWRPFYEMLDTLNEYKLDRHEALTLKRNSITEFNELASCIERMTTKINHEFTIQKEFIENASHEIQTPLAIIKTEMEVLIQSPVLSERQMQSISGATAAANRLSKLNEALLILARIENRQFHVVEDICVNDLLIHSLENFEELIAMKSIKLVRCLQERLYIKMNRYLAEILVENLLNNAIKHNHSPGVIMVAVEKNEIVISNMGDRPRNRLDQLFGRFVKGNPQSESLGLGLPIVKAICEVYMYTLTYTYEDKFHRVTIGFSNKGAEV